MDDTSEALIARAILLVRSCQQESFCLRRRWEDFDMLLMLLLLLLLLLVLMRLLMVLSL